MWVVPESMISMVAMSVSSSMWLSDTCTVRCVAAPYGLILHFDCPVKHTNPKSHHYIVVPFMIQSYSAKGLSPP